MNTELVTPVYLEDFSDREDVTSNFEDDLDGFKILLAIYSTGNYEGDSYVLAEKDGKLYENYASHCSCYGLEGMWEPEETSVQAIADRMLNSKTFGVGDCNGASFRNELTKILSDIIL